mgnify:CR=1 FL=1
MSLSDIRTRIEAKAGLGPLRFSEDGRWGMTVNPVDNVVFVIDAATDTSVDRAMAPPMEIGESRIRAQVSIAYEIE